MSLSPEAIANAAGARGLVVPGLHACKQLAAYGDLFMRWNGRLNLSAIRNEEEILDRHILEGIAAAQNVSPDSGTLLDFGSGGGIPGIPIAVCRPEISVVLAESNQKKAAFLREVDRTLQCGYRVHAGRVEDLHAGEQFATVTMRAVDRMAEMLPVAVARLLPGGEVLLLTTVDRFELLRAGLGAELEWRTVHQPQAEMKILQIGRRR